MTGGFASSDIKAFWEHCRQFDEWKHHPIFSEEDVDMGRCVPVCFHCDGAEFFRNSEYIVWNMSSIFTDKDSDVWDVKFPNVIIPHANMKDEEVQRYAHSKVASAMSWSMWQSMKGIGPEFDMDNDRLTSPFQLSLKGTRLAGGWKLVYFGWKADLKARVQAHFFSNYYLCNSMCDRCFATVPTANEQLAFTHLGEDAACWMTELSHSDYARHFDDRSPWMEMPGFRLETVFFDAMHILWLGTARVLLGSCLGVWHRLGFLGIRHHMPTFTKSNTIQDDWAELGSVFKAMSVKTSLWYFCVKAAEFSRARPEERMAKLITVCLWSLYDATKLLDACGLQLYEDEAEDAHSNICKHCKTWQFLAAACVEKGWRCFKCKPKLHYLLHNSRQMRRTKLNLFLLGAVWAGESFLGKLKRVGIKCHQASLMRRLFARILLLLSLRFRQSRE
ncbi:unnamed protein product [Symbiodinium sp. CCMP2592]|nr:unnamed protein product [Symbiodinium sp. CCMP2592]